MKTYCPHCKKNVKAEAGKSQIKGLIPCLCPECKRWVYRRLKEEELTKIKFKNEAGNAGVINEAGNTVFKNEAGTPEYIGEAADHVWLDEWANKVYDNEVSEHPLIKQLHESICPDCNKPVKRNHDRCFSTCDQYGNTTFVLECEHCGKYYLLSLRKTIVVDRLERTDRKDLSF